MLKIKTVIVTAISQSQDTWGYTPGLVLVAEESFNWREALECLHIEYVLNVEENSYSKVVLFVVTVNALIFIPYEWVKVTTYYVK